MRRRGWRFARPKPDARPRLFSDAKGDPIGRDSNADCAGRDSDADCAGRDSDADSAGYDADSDSDSAAYGITPDRSGYRRLFRRLCQPRDQQPVPDPARQ